MSKENKFVQDGSELIEAVELQHVSFRSRYDSLAESVKNARVVDKAWLKQKQVAIETKTEAIGKAVAYWKLINEILGGYENK